MINGMGLGSIATQKSLCFNFEQKRSYGYVLAWSIESAGEDGFSRGAYR